MIDAPKNLRHIWNQILERHVMFRLKTLSIRPSRYRSSVLVVIAMAFSLVAVTSNEASAEFDTVTSLTASNPAAYSNQLSDVSCVSTSLCMSVVEGRESSSMSATANTFLTQWDGYSWSVVPTSGWPTGFRATDIACAATNMCLVTGSVDTFNMSNMTLETTPYLMLWNGSTISQVTLPNVIYTLNAVSCASATFCLAVGSSSETPRKSLVLRWDGTTLTRETSSMFSNGTNDEDMLDVDCDTSRRCVGVTSINLGGGSFSGEILDRGSVAGTWSRLTGRTDTLGQLQTVDCQPGAVGLCAVVGSMSNGNGALMYDLGADMANKFRNVSLPVMPSGGLTNALTSKKMSCASTTRCVLVGDFMFAMPNTESYVGVWDGSTWTRLTSSSGVGGSRISDINCPTVSQCVAVGSNKATSGMMAPNSAAAWFIRDAALVAAPSAGSTPTTTTPTTIAPTTTTATTTTSTTAKPTVNTPSTTVLSSATTTSVANAVTTTLPAPALSIVKALPKASKPIVSEASIVTSEAITVSFGGFTPFEYVQLIVASTPKVIGSGYANAQGVVTITGTLPNSLSSGSHTLAVYAPKSGVGFSQAITVSQAKLPATGFDVPILLILLSALLLVGYLSLWQARRRSAI
jgi:hypothetical protein